MGAAYSPAREQARAQHTRSRMGHTCEPLRRLPIDLLRVSKMPGTLTSSRVREATGKFSTMMFPAKNIQGRVIQCLRPPLF